MKFLRRGKKGEIKNDWGERRFKRIKNEICTEEKIGNERNLKERIRHKMHENEICIDKREQKIGEQEGIKVMKMKFECKRKEKKRMIGKQNVV